MENNKNLKMIPLENLYPNPLNPRQNVGDCTELSDSIRAVGILQNLTVVPYDPAVHTGLTVTDPAQAMVVVIGHRRRKGAELAGLTEAPCVVEGFSAKQQVAIMITENSERQDLTPYEEAMGYQMLLDMGESVESVAKETGISVSTVRSRCKLLDLDRDKFKAAQDRGATLSDYAELNKLESADLKNLVLETIGTKNFRNTLDRALDKEKNRKWLAQALNDVRNFATELTTEPDTDIYSQKFTYSWWGTKTVTVPDDAETTPYFFYATDDMIKVYQEKTEADTDAAEKLKQIQQEHEQRKQALRAASYRAYKLRCDFIRSYPYSMAKKNLGKISAFACDVAIHDTGIGYYAGQINRKIVADLLNIPYIEAESNYERDAFLEIIQKHPEKGMLVIGTMLLDREHFSYAKDSWVPELQRWCMRYQSQDTLDRIYNFLTDIGYQMSDEELQLQNGTHPLFEDDDTNPKTA